MSRMKRFIVVGVVFAVCVLFYLLSPASPLKGSDTDVRRSATVGGTNKRGDSSLRGGGAGALPRFSADVELFFQQQLSKRGELPEFAPTAEEGDLELWAARRIERSVLLKKNPQLRAWAEKKLNDAEFSRFLKLLEQLENTRNQRKVITVSGTVEAWCSHLAPRGRGG